MSKNFFVVPGEELTEEQREAARKLEESKSEQTKSDLEKIDKQRSEKKVEFMNPPFRPHEDRVLIYPDKVKENKTAAGIIIPTEAIEAIRPITGTVVRVGPGKPGTMYTKQSEAKYDSGQSSSLPLKEGDRVYYGNYANTMINIGGIDYLIMRFADIFGRAE